MEARPVKVAIYTRVSRPEQDPENQLNALMIWAKNRGFDIVEVYQEEETAWHDGHQHELAKLIREARGFHFRIVLVWALDRLSRQGPLTILSLVRKLGQYGVKVMSYQEPWTEASGEMQELLLSIAGWVAKMESQRISERTKAGMARKRRELEARGEKMPVRGPDRKQRKRRSVRRESWLPI